MPIDPDNLYHCGCPAPADEECAGSMECQNCSSGEYRQSIGVAPKKVLPDVAPVEERAPQMDVPEDQDISPRAGRRTTERSKKPVKGVRARSQRNLSKVQRKRVLRAAQKAREQEQQAELAQAIAEGKVIPISRGPKERTDESHRPTHGMCMIPYRGGRR